MKYVRNVEGKGELRNPYRDIVGKIEGNRELEISDRSVVKPTE
jgi:hypothetical protein